MNISKSLKIALINKNLRQRDLATKMGVSEQLISRWAIVGLISTGNLEKLCQALDLQVSEFFALGED